MQVLRATFRAASTILFFPLESVAAKNPKLGSSDEEKDYASMEVPKLLEEFRDWMLHTQNYSEKTAKPKVRKVKKIFPRNRTEIKRGNTRTAKTLQGLSTGQG